MLSLEHLLALMGFVILGGFGLHGIGNGLEHIKDHLNGRKKFFD